jgi:hypothetical protein
MKAKSKAIIFGRYANIGITEVQAQSELYYFNNFIKLKPLSSISDDDARLLGAYNSREFLKDYITAFFKDELRQLGYATPQTVIEYGKAVTYSVEELVKLGIYKLI